MLMLQLQHESHDQLYFLLFLSQGLSVQHTRQSPSACLTLLIPSYFGPTLYTKVGSTGPPIISSTLHCTSLKFCKVLDIPFKISENTRFVKNLLYGYHGNCLITWCFSLTIVKTSMKNRYFSNAPRNHKLEGVKINICVMIVLFIVFFKKVILKWVEVPDFWELQVEK